jgi:hypothetical protein
LGADAQKDEVEEEEKEDEEEVEREEVGVDVEEGEENQQIANEMDSLFELDSYPEF